MSKIHMFLTTLSLITMAIGSVNTGDPSARVRGDLVIGALFSVHRAPSGGQGALVCGTVRELYGIERVETALITLDKINRDNTILPGVTLGLEARDSCWSAPVSLQQSLELVRDAITPALTQSQLTSNGESTTCQADSSVQTESPVTKAPIVGVVGPGSSSAALQVQNLLQLFSIPQIGYSPTSRDLSDKTRYPTFLRVVPSDYYQAQLLVDLVQYFNWTYVSIVNTDENYGQSGMQAFRELAERNGVCVAREDSVLSTAEESVFDGVLTNLDQDRFANVVVCFCEGMTMRGLLGATKRLNLTGRFVFIGSDGWADRDDVVENLENEARGSLSIRIYSPYINEFDDHYFSLNPFNNTRNPWFVEFWQHKFNCVMPKAAGIEEETSGIFDEASEVESNEKLGQRVISGTEVPDTRRVCTGTEKLSEKYKQDPKMSFVMKSFWTMAHGLHSMLEEICGRGYNGVCKEMYPFNGTLFKNHLMNTSFTFGEEEVEFDRRGDPPGRYEILNFQLMANGSYGYVQIGDWNNGTLTFSASPQSRSTQLVTSVCSKPCQPGHYKNFKTGGQEKKCCWACVPCDYHEIVNEEQTACVACPAGQKPNANKTQCDVILVEHISWGDAEAVVAMSFSAMGLVATFVTCHIFIRHNDTPVVKASTRELSYLILAGMTLAHITVFPILAEPTRISCALSRLMPGISFAMMYASLFTKTNRIARILAGSKKRFPKRKPLFMSGTAQVVITCFLIMVEAGIAAAMLVIEPPMPRYEYPTRDRSVLTCATSPRAVLSPLAFDGLLVALCTLYAVKTRNVPENFNEAKFIGFAMYTTCVIWIAFGPIYFGSESKVVTMCMCVTLSASVTLVFLFLPKLYIIVLRPERNNRALFTTSKSIRCHIGARVAAAIAEPPAKQAIYRLATGDSDITDQRSSVARRTLSVQTSSELLAGMCKQPLDDRSTSPMLKYFVDSEYPNSPTWRCKFDTRISKSSDNVQLKPRNYEKETIVKKFKDSTFVRRSHEKLYASAKSLGSRMSLFVGRSETSIKMRENSKTRLPDCHELDAKVLMIASETRNIFIDEKSHGNTFVRSNGKTGNGSVVQANNEENDATIDEASMTCNEPPEFLRDRRTRIREEHANRLSSNGEPLINITITLGNELPDLRELSQSTV